MERKSQQTRAFCDIPLFCLPPQSTRAMSHCTTGLPALGADLDAELADLVAAPAPQHATYSAAFLRELHSFVRERVAEATVRASRLA